MYVDYFLEGDGTLSFLEAFYPGIHLLLLPLIMARPFFGSLVIRVTHVFLDYLDYFVSFLMKLTKLNPPWAE